MKVTQWLALVAALLISAVTAASVSAASPITDASVGQLAQSGGRVYMAGDFRYVGPYTGTLARFDGANGAANGTFPVVDGPIMAITSDGAGGWYIGGSFSTIGGEPHRPLPHIPAGGRLHPRVKPLPHAPR